MTEVKKSADYQSVAGDPFWFRKMRTMFRRLDTRGHGFVNLADFLCVATDVIGSFSNTDSYKGDNIVNAVVKLWYGVLSTQVEEKERTSVIANESVFVENLKAGCQVDSELKMNFDEIIIEPFFVAADEDDDGKITLLQFKNLMKAWKAPDLSLDTIFRLYDSSKSGKITKDEFEYIMADFFFSECSKSKTSTLFGRLVNYKRPEDYGESDFGPIWEGKMRTMFRRFDVSNSTKLKCHDFIQIARNIAHRGRMDKKRANNVLRAMLNVWVKWIAIDKEGRHIAEVTEREFIHNLRFLVNGAYRHEIDQFGWTFFKSMEVDGSGFVSFQEYRNLQEAWGISREEAEGMFKVLDLDKDGKLSSDEYLTGWVDYFLSEDSKSPYRGFFGPVIAKFEAR